MCPFFPHCSPDTPPPKAVHMEVMTNKQEGKPWSWVSLGKRKGGAWDQVSENFNIKWLSSRERSWNEAEKQKSGRSEENQEKQSWKLRKERAPKAREVINKMW